MKSVFFIVFMFITCSAQLFAATPGYDAVRSAMASGKPTLVDLGADYCPPCIKMKPILAELKEELAGKVNIIVIDVEEETLLAERLNIRSIPVQIFYDAKGKQRKRHLGFMSKKQILAELEKL